MKSILVALALLALTGCAAMRESAERQDRARQACAARGDVWHPVGWTHECVSRAEAARRDAAERRERESKERREHELHRDCVQSGGTWYGSGICTPNARPGREIRCERNRYDGSVTCREQ